VSAESYTEQQFYAARRNPAFARRLAAFSRGTLGTEVVDSSTPIGESMSQIVAGDVIAICDEDSEHGFMLVRIAAVD